MAIDSRFGSAYSRCDFAYGDIFDTFGRNYISDNIYNLLPSDRGSPSHLHGIASYRNRIIYLNELYIMGYNNATLS